jgi:MoaD family protein
MNVTVEVSFSFKADLVDHPVTLALAEEEDVNTALRALVAKYPQVSLRIFTDGGDVHPYINVLKNGGNVRFQRGFKTALHDRDHLTIVPPVGGG